MGAAAYQSQFENSQIPVDSVVLYQSPGMDDFQLCHVLNVSNTALDALFTHALPLSTRVTIAVGDESDSEQFMQLVGEVQSRHAVNDEWMHSISVVPENRSSASSFIYNVVCSNAEHCEDLVENYRSSYATSHLNTVTHCEASLPQ